MIITPLLDLTYEATNLADDTTPQWSNTAGYALDTIRQLNNKLYKALDSMHPLCTYIYDNTDPLNPHYTVTAIDGVEVADNTAVPCVQDTTVVYVVDDRNYYKYKNQADANIDFTIEPMNPPTNFNLLTAPASYRYLRYNPEDTPLKWEDLGYTNKYKCLDQSLSSQTEATTDITMSFIVSKIDEVNLMNLYGSSVTVTVTPTAGGGAIYDETTSLINKNGGTFYDWVFNDFTYTTKINSEIPINFEVQVDITISHLNNVAKLGLVGIGKGIKLGGTLYGAGLGMLDFSKKLVNSTTGENYLEQGNFKATNNLTVDVEAGLTDAVYNTLIKHRATPVIFRNDVYDSLTMFGIYNKFNILISTPTISRMTIDLESLI